MKIGGFIKNSLIDYPGKIASVVFTQGCNFQCGYCHNPELVLPEMFKEAIDENYIFNYIKKNKSLLDAVVISGGEPTVQVDLMDFIIKIKSFGLLVKLDTNGTKPGVLNDLIEMNLLDYIAMDIKAPLELKKYQQIVGDFVNFETIDNIKNSIWLILKSHIPYEFRTTTIKQITTKEDIIQICESINGCQNFCLQDFNPEVVLDESFKENNGYSAEVLEWISNELDNYAENLNIR